MSPDWVPTYLGGFGAVLLAYVGQLFANMFPKSGLTVQLETAVVKHSDQMLLDWKIL